MKKLILYFSLIGYLFFLGCSSSIFSEYPYNAQDTVSLQKSKPKNIILMIGDGMGLSQISAAMYKNGGQLYLEEAQYIGLIKTNSSSSIITQILTT